MSHAAQTPGHKQAKTKQCGLTFSEQNNDATTLEKIQCSNVTSSPRFKFYCTRSFICKSGNKVLSRSLFYCNALLLLKKKTSELSLRHRALRTIKKSTVQRQKALKNHFCTPVHDNGGQGCVSASAPLPRLSHSHSLFLSLSGKNAAQKAITFIRGTCMMWH